MKATVSWKGNMAFEGQSGSGHRILMDAPAKAGGEDRGPSPMETVLMSLGGCTGIDVISILQKMRLDVKDLQVEIEAERAADHPRVFNKITMVYKVWGDNLPEDKVKRAVELTQEKYCSVLHMVNKTAEVEYSFQINP
ncbi:MAG: OsmC family protein [Thermoanaerobacteraceae bacterium]|nr:OsmC family protein [Thermoanaerobacteraceae bacterium]